MSIEPNKWTGVADFITRLTIQKILTAAVCGVVAVILYAMYEARAQVLSDLGSSPLMAGAVAAGVVLMVLGIAFTSLQQRVDDRSDELLSSLRGQIDELRIEVRRVSEAEHECQQRMLEILERMQLRQEKPS